MKRLRATRKVDRVLKDARREVKATLRELNQHAGKLMARADYSAAGELAELGRAVTDFEGKLDGLRRDWRMLWRAKKPAEAKGVTTPLWEYYQLILQAIDALGGEASRREIEQHLESRAVARLKPGDLAPRGRRGTPRWKLMVRRARKQMIRQKYLENEMGKQWRITSLGRQVAQGDFKVPAEA